MRRQLLDDALRAQASPSAATAGGASVGTSGGPPTDTGVIAVITALVAVLLFVFAAIAVDIGRWYSEGEMLQRTADAAALAGAPYLPGDLATAQGAANALIAENVPEAQIPSLGIDITVGDRPSQLKVEMSSTIPNAFGTVVGQRFKKVTRSAVAEFAAPVTMGGSCNVLGNTAGTSSSCPGGDTAKLFWNSIAGPEVSKDVGDRYVTRSCATGNSNCEDPRNLDYYGGRDLPSQSYYVYRFSTSRPVSSMTVQAFDPMFVAVGEQCDAPGTPPTSEALCTGDTLVEPAPVVGPAAGATVPAPVRAQQEEPIQAAPTEAVGLNTTFLVVNPTDTLDPMKSTAACAPQSFHGVAGDITSALVPGPQYNDELARNFRQWADLCRIDSPVVGRDYYLIVRSNVPFGASAAQMLNPAEDPSTGGEGVNRFGLRVIGGGGSPNGLSISALDRLPIEATVGQYPTEYQIARVTSAHSGGLLTVSLFDFADSPGGGGRPVAVRIKEPDLSNAENCEATGDVRSGSLSDCVLSIPVEADQSYGGKIQRIQVPIPDDYTCDDADPTDCWYRLWLEGGPNFQDAMTLSASLDGDPVRLVE